MARYGAKRPKGYRVLARVRKAEEQNLRWTPDELLAVRNAVRAGCTLDQVHALMPYRTRHSVKDQFYRAKEPQEREEPGSISDARRRKDAATGSAMLLERLMMVFPEMVVRRAG
jgi:hypothetical protein